MNVENLILTSSRNEQIVPNCCWGVCNSQRLGATNYSIQTKRQMLDKYGGNKQHWDQEITTGKGQTKYVIAKLYCYIRIGMT